MKTRTLKLQEPIIRGENIITEIVLHKPNVSAARGTSMSSIVNMNVDAIATILPRISEPKLIDTEVEKMDVADLLQAGIMIAGFFLPISEEEWTA